MGQRLVITIKNDKQDLAKAYYHWSGYTSSGLQISNMAIQHYTEAIEKTAEFCTLQAISQTITKTDHVKSDQSMDLLTACYMLFGTRAGLSNEYDTETAKNPEIAAFTDAYPGVNYMISVNRNDGIISITEKGMGHLQKWSEADVVIDIHNKIIDVSGLFFNYADSDDENDDEGNEKHISTSIPGTYDIEKLSFEEFPKFIKTIIVAISNKCYDFEYNGNHLGVIE